LNLPSGDGLEQVSVVNPRCDIAATPVIGNRSRNLVAVPGPPTDRKSSRVCPNSRNRNKSGLSQVSNFWRLRIIRFHVFKIDATRFAGETAVDQVLLVFFGPAF
jgi:hypothetical protein